MMEMMNGCSVCLQVPSFYIRVLLGITETEIIIYGKHKTKSLGKRKA